MNYSTIRLLSMIWIGILSAQELPKDTVNSIKRFGGDFQPNGACENLYCAMPMRYFPILDEGNGDYYGLYYPRGKANPWIVLFGHEETRHWVITTASDKFIANKGKYTDDKIATPDDETFPYRISLEVMLSGKYPNADIASFPVSFLADNLDWGIYDPKVKKYVKSGKEVRDWFHASLAGNAPYNNAFSDSELIMQWKPWMKLGRIYEQEGKISHAMNCVDMAIQMSHRYPNYGEPAKANPSWKRLLEILEEAKSIVIKSDAIDKYTYDIIYQSAISFSKE